MLERLSRLAFLGKSLNFIKKSIFLRLVMNADMIPGMAYEPHGFKFKMRCLKGIILESGKLIHPVDGLQTGYNEAAAKTKLVQSCFTYCWKARSSNVSNYHFVSNCCLSVRNTCSLSLFTAQSILFRSRCRAQNLWEFQAYFLFCRLCVETSAVELGRVQSSLRTASISHPWQEAHTRKRKTKRSRKKTWYSQQNVRCF